MTRVVLLTRDGAYSRQFVRRLVSESDIEVVGLVLSTSYLWRGKPLWQDLPAYVKRVGIPYALYQAYVAWVLPWRHGRSLSGSLSRFARQRGVPVLETNDVNEPGCQAWLRGCEPDFLLSFHFNQRIDESVALLPKRAALNFHPSLLPDWRGVDPVFFALEERSRPMGASIHLMAPGLDEGDVLLQQTLDRDVEGLVACNMALFDLGGRMAASVLSDYDAIYPRRQSQQGVEGRYYSWADVGKRPFRFGSL